MFHGMSPGRNVASLGQESDRIYPGACGPETAGALQHRAMGNCGLVWGDEDDEVTQASATNHSVFFDVNGLELSFSIFSHLRSQYSELAKTFDHCKECFFLICVPSLA